MGGICIIYDNALGQKLGYQCDYDRWVYCLYQLSLETHDAAKIDIRTDISIMITSHILKKIYLPSEKISVDSGSGLCHLSLAK
jgi:hypothetical protein